jgi:hypothetical protein
MQAGLVEKTNLLLSEKVVLSLASSTLQIPSFSIYYITLADFPLLAVYIRILFRPIYLELLFIKMFNVQYDIIYAGWIDGKNQYVTE